MKVRCESNCDGLVSFVFLAILMILSCLDFEAACFSLEYRFRNTSELALLLSRSSHTLAIDWHVDAAERIGFQHSANVVMFSDYHPVVRLSWETVRLR